MIFGLHLLNNMSKLLHITTQKEIDELNRKSVEVKKFLEEINKNTKPLK
jgi:hypothetical protein